MRDVIGPVAEEGEPARVAHDDVELVAVDDEHGLAVGGLVQRVVDDFDAAEIEAGVIAREFVVIARHIDDARALARLAQQLLDDVIVRLRPVPAALQPPAVDDVADEIDRVGVVVFEEIEQQFGLGGRARRDAGRTRNSVR